MRFEFRLSDVRAKFLVFSSAVECSLGCLVDFGHASPLSNLSFPAVKGDERPAASEM